MSENPINVEKTAEPDSIENQNTTVHTNTHSDDQPKAKKPMSTTNIVLIIVGVILLLICCCCSFLVMIGGNGFAEGFTESYCEELDGAEDILNLC